MKKKTLLLALPFIALISSCGEKKDSSEGDPLDQNDITILEKFQKGFRLEGTLSSLKTYYSDNGYDVPLDTKEQVKNNYSYTLIYQNSDSYTGLDRRYYRVTSEGNKKYLSGENAYDNDGYVGLNYLNYNNVVKTDGYSSTDGYNEDTYSSSGLINPFLALKKGDFHKKDGKIYLDNTKNNLLYNLVFSGLAKYVNLGIPLEDGVFSSDFTSYTSSSIDFKGTAYENYTTYYVKTKYTINFTFSEIGEANAKDALKKEETKSENDPLGKALKNMVGKSITIDRHSITYEGSEKIESEESVKTFNDGTNIYMQVYDHALTPNGPTTPSASDLYLKAESNKKLGTYVLSGENEDGTYSFKKDSSTNYSSLNGLYTYSNFQPVFSISQDIFNKNEDGSYSPTEDNLPYIGGDCFVPAISSTTEISNGYITSMKIYLSNDSSYIDHIQFLFEEDIYTGYTGEIIVTYSNVGNTSLPFSIVA